MLPGSSNLQKHINQSKTKRSPFAVQAQLNPYSQYEETHKQATLEMVLAHSNQAKQFPAAGQRTMAGAGKNIVAGPNGTAKFHQNVADFFDASRPSTGCVKVVSHPERFHPPDQIKQQLHKEKMYEQRQKYDRNALFGGKPNHHYGPGDSLDRELAKNNELRKNFQLFHYGQANPKIQFKEDMSNFYDIKGPDPTPRTYHDSNHRAQLMIARANERTIDKIARGESRSKRAARIEADSNFKRAYSEFFDKSDPTPSSSQLRNSAQQVRNAYQGGSNPGVAQQDVNFDRSKKAFFDNKTPTGSRQMRKASVPQKNSQKIDYESNVYGGPSYSYMKNKASFYGEESTGLPKSNQINFNRAKSAFFGVDSSPAYKGKDHGSRYDPYRDSNIGNVRHISPTPGLNEDRRVQKPRGGAGAFALF